MLACEHVHLTRRLDLTPVAEASHSLEWGVWEHRFHQFDIGMLHSREVKAALTHAPL